MADVVIAMWMFARSTGGIAWIAAAACASAGEPELAADRPTDGCIDGDERRERNGTDCLCCHTEFGVAGSVAEGSSVARVIVRDALGLEIVVAPNAYENFFRHVPVEPPLTASVVHTDGTRSEMLATAPHGSCNRCHGDGMTAPPVGSR